MSSLVSPPLRGLTSITATDTWTFQSPATFTNTYTDTFSNTYTPTNNFTATAPATTVTPTGSPMRWPQTSPRSPLTSVRNIVAAWKERTPAKSSPKSSPPGSVTSASSPPYVPGHLGLRRQTGRLGGRPRQDRSESQADSEETPFDVGDLTQYTKGNTKVSNLPFLESLSNSQGSMRRRSPRGSVCCGTSMFMRHHLIGGSDAKPFCTPICYYFRGLSLAAEGA